MKDWELKELMGDPQGNTDNSSAPQESKTFWDKVKDIAADMGIGVGTGGTLYNTPEARDTINDFARETVNAQAPDLNYNLVHDPVQAGQELQQIKDTEHSPFLNSFASNLNNNVESATGQALNFAGENIKYLAPDRWGDNKQYFNDAGDWLINNGTYLNDQARNDLPERFSSEYDTLASRLLDLGYWANPRGLAADLGQMAGGAVQMLPLLAVPGLGEARLAALTTRFASGLLGEAGLGSIAKIAASDGFRTGLTNAMGFGMKSGALQAASNAGGIYDDLKEQGYTDDQIAQQMQTMFVNELPLDTANEMITGTILPGKLGKGIFGDGASRAKNFGRNFLVNVPLAGVSGRIDETEQQILQDKYSNKPYGTLLNPTPNENAAGAAGAIAGLFPATFGAARGSMRKTYNPDSKTESVNVNDPPDAAGAADNTDNFNTDTEAAATDANNNSNDSDTSLSGADILNNIKENDPEFYETLQNYGPDDMPENVRDIYNSMNQTDAQPQTNTDFKSSGNGDVDSYIQNASQQTGVPANLLSALVSAESSYNPDAKSSAGAVGLTQLMPGTAEALGVDATDPEQNVLGGAIYLKQQYDKYGNWRDALIAYNEGPGARDEGKIYQESADYADGILNNAGNVSDGSNSNTDTYNLPTQGADIDEQINSLNPEFKSALPRIGGILNDMGLADGAVISSGNRTPEHNAEVGGAENSYHTHGDAVDIVLPDSASEEQANAVLQRFKDSGAFKEVLFHDAGSGYHLHLGGYQGGLDSSTRTSTSSNTNENSNKPLFDLNSSDDDSQIGKQQIADFADYMKNTSSDAKTVNFFEGMFNTDRKGNDVFQNTSENQQKIKNDYGTELNDYIKSAQQQVPSQSNSINQSLISQAHEAANSGDYQTAMQLAYRAGDNNWGQAYSRMRDRIENERNASSESQPIQIKQAKNQQMQSHLYTDNINPAVQHPSAPKSAGEALIRLAKDNQVPMNAKLQTDLQANKPLAIKTMQNRIAQKATKEGLNINENTESKNTEAPQSINTKNQISNNIPEQGEKGQVTPFDEHTINTNIRKGQQAIDTAILTQGNVRGAMRRSDIGDIDIIWGKAGDPAKNYKNGYGVSHIIARRNAQGLDGESVVKIMPEVIMRGEKTPGLDSSRVELHRDNYTAVLSNNPIEGQQGGHWLLTGFKKIKKGESVNERGEGFDSPTTTTPAPTLHASQGRNGSPIDIIARDTREINTSENEKVSVESTGKTSDSKYNEKQSINESDKTEENITSEDENNSPLPDGHRLYNIAKNNNIPANYKKLSEDIGGNNPVKAEKAANYLKTQLKTNGINPEPILSKRGYVPLKEGQYGSISNSDIVPAAPEKVKNVTAPEIRKAVNNLVQTYIGKTGSKAFDGLYDTRNKTARIRSYSDFDTYAHEIGHAIDDTLKIKGYDKELIDNAKKLWGNNPIFQKYFKDTKRAEGIAEFGRQYLLDANEAEKNFPQYYKAFSDELKNHPDFAKKINNISNAMRNWYNQSPEARTRGMISYGTELEDKTFKQKVKEKIEKLRTQWIDKLHGLDKLSAKAEVYLGEKLPYEKNPYKLARMANTSPMTRTELFFGKNVKDIKKMMNVFSRLYDKKFHNVMMTDILHLISDDRMNKKYPDYLKNGNYKTWDQALGGYLIAKRSLEVRKVNYDEPIKRAQDELSNTTENVLKLKRQYLDAVDRFKNNKVKSARELLLQDIKNADKAQQQAQTEQHRIISEINSIRRQGYKTPINIKDAKQVTDNAPKEIKAAAEKIYQYNDNLLAVQEASGLISSEDAETLRKKYKYYVPMSRDFMESGTEKIFGKGKEFINVSNLVERLEKGGSDWLTKNPIETMMENTYKVFSAAERNKVGQSIVNLNNIPEMAKFLVEMPEGTTSDAKKSIFTVMFDGKKKAYQTIPEIYDSINNLNEPAFNSLLSFAGLFTKALRIGATGVNPSFIIRNIIKDTITAATYDKDMTPFLSTIKGVKTLMGDDEINYEYRASGAPMAALVGLDRQSIKKQIEIMTKDGRVLQLPPMRRIGYVTEKMLEAFRKTGETAENATRIAAFEKARKRGSSITEAGLIAKEITVDFSRSGTAGQKYNMLSAFFNASLQGTDRMIRAFKNDPIGTTWRVGKYIVLPSLILWALNSDQDWYKDKPAWEKDAYWMFSPDGGNTIIRIPKPMDTGILFGSGIERALDQATGKDPIALKRWSHDVIAAFAPNVLPSAIGPAIENTVNYSFFSGRPIENARDLMRSSGNRYDAYTSELAKKIGALTGFSPKKIDNAVQGYFGGAGKFLVESVNPFIGNHTTMPNKGISDIPLVSSFVQNGKFSQSQALEDFYSTYEKMKQDHTDSGKKAPPAQLRNMTLYKNKVDALLKLNRNVLDSNMSGDEKASKIFTNGEKIHFLTREANKKFPPQ